MGDLWYGSGNGTPRSQNQDLVSDFTEKLEKITKEELKRAEKELKKEKKKSFLLIPGMKPPEIREIPDVEKKRTAEDTVKRIVRTKRPEPEKRFVLSGRPEKYQVDVKAQLEKMDLRKKRS